MAETTIYSVKVDGIDETISELLERSGTNTILCNSVASE
jgi:hypothetical protein